MRVRRQPLPVAGIDAGGPEPESLAPGQPHLQRWVSTSPKSTSPSSSHRGAGKRHVHNAEAWLLRWGISHIHTARDNEIVLRPGFKWGMTIDSNAGKVGLADIFCIKEYVAIPALNKVQFMDRIVVDGILRTRHAVTVLNYLPKWRNNHPCSAVCMVHWLPWHLNSGFGCHALYSTARVEVLKIQKFRRMVSYAGFYCFTTLITYAYTSNTTRAGISRADQYYASYPAGTELLTDTAKLYKAALGNCFEIDDWGPIEFSIMARHFDRQGNHRMPTMLNILHTSSPTGSSTEAGRSCAKMLSC